ncbi:phytanoyl-CoA dioxygenase family protein [Gimesia algae]|uniref:Phytanoyl-CoA dioxygenase (PhyH) n=1 Tax=Gimesia algae TaxID=2527971 RepID=A0A517V7U2_9PLAN|nr:phytanoyl-CoA dioxygenase family protein [Gimesia algae]QDT89076.1 Phytanoyl-CoA dioxygenase (PhyH) [Gimesia algae]
MSEITDCQLEQAGYQKVSAPLPSCTHDILEEVLDSVVQENFRRRRNGTRYAIRNALLAVPALRPLLEHGALVELARGVLGQTVALVSATLFDKRPAANWFVPPHQDLFVPIAGATNDPRWTNWSIKAGVQYVEPPVEMQRELLAVRVHLDACPGVNGALEVVPGSHRERLSEESVAEFNEEAFEVCPAGPGEVLLMRPLLVHRSRAAKLPARRRVLHVVYSAAELPKGLKWT